MDQQFIVSARKYRPDNFNTVVGQASITTTLKNAIKTSHLAQAYLFCGPRGVGKTTCARIFAKTINCMNLTEQVEACNECESCKSFNESRAFNIHELDAASNNSVDDIRTLIDQVRIPPQVGKYSIYIIDEVHMLSQAAFNAFLKTLEEPPKHAIFILATTEKHKIIPTILSRCQIFDFNRITVNDAVGYLEYIAKEESIEYEVEGLNIIGQKADGAMRDALSIFDQVVSFSENNKITYQGVIDNLNVLDYEYYFRLTDAFLTEDISTSLITFDDILNKGFDAHNFINGLSSHFRDLLVCKDQATIKLMEVGDSIKQKYAEQANKCATDFLFNAIYICNDCDVNYRLSKNKRLHVEFALVKLANILTKKKSENAELEKKAAEENKTGATNKDELPPISLSANYDKVSSTPSIKDALKKKPTRDDGPVKKQDPVENEKKELQKEPFNEESLNKTWLLYVEEVKKNGPRMYSSLKDEKLKLLDNNEVVLEFGNSAILDEFEQTYKQRAKYFLRRHLKNDLIEVTLKITKENKKNTNILYTPQDKFKYLADKNPLIDKLRQDFNLDYE